MKKFFINIFLFSLPIILFCLFIVIIDPYNYFNVSDFIDKETRYEMINRSHDVKSKGNMLWKSLDFKRNPSKNIIIGDSQGFYFREELIKEQTGEDYFNFCVPAASVETTTNIFWYVVHIIKPEKVYMQVSFALSNSEWSYDLFNYAKEYMEKPYLYFTKRDILIDSYFNLAYKITKDPKWIVDPYQSKPVNEIDSMSEAWAGVIFKDYVYPESYFNELIKLKEYCHDNDIQLEFIFLPCFNRVNEYLSENNLIEQQDRFRQQIAKLGITYDFTGDRNIVFDRSNFYDYFHPNQFVTDSITRNIWSKTN